MTDGEENAWRGRVPLVGVPTLARENLTPEQRDDYSVAARRLTVLADLDAFRQRLGRRADTSPNP